MAEPFKNFLGPREVRAAAAHLQRAWPGFPHERFERLALDGLEALEFKARAHHIADALEATLPADFARAADVLEASLGPPGEGDDLGSLQITDAGLAGWIVWPMTEYVARRGLDHPRRALAALHAMTQRFSAEWAIRPFIERHPKETFAALERWTRDPSAHVRRLVSEGSRPRLPWGVQLKALIADPTPTLHLLEALQDDPSEYVRRSVANHLNDIAKDHPARVSDWIERHLPGAGPGRRALLKHASRTLVKRGDARMLALWGVGTPLRGTASLAVAPKRVRVGESVSLHVTLASSAARAQDLVIDYAVHFVGARDGATSRKVFKGWSLALAPRESRTLLRRHSLRPITTRVYRAGDHRVELMINGRTVAEAVFRLVT